MLLLVQAGSGSISDVAALQRVPRKAVGGSEQIPRRPVRPVAKRSLCRLVVLRVVAAVDDVERAVLVGESVVHLVVVMLMHVLVIG